MMESVRAPGIAIGGAPKRRTIILFLGLSIGSLGAGALGAADVPLDPDLDTQNLRRAGPFQIRPFLLLKEVGYDDNIRLESQEPEGDTTATGGVGMDAFLRAGDRGGLRLFQEFDYVAFGQNSDLNHWNRSTRARGIFLLKRMILSAEDRLTSVQERPNNEIDERLRRQNNVITVAGRTVTKGRLGARTHVRHEHIEYDTGDAFSSQVAERLNRDQNAFSLAGELRLLPKTTFTLEGVFERMDFEDDSEGRDSRARSALAGFRFDPSAALQGEFKVGVIRLTARERPESDFRGTIGEAALGTKLGRKARLKGTFARDLVFSTGAENLYYIGRNWTAAYEQFFSHRVSAELLYGRGLNHYPLPVGTLFRDDHITTGQLSVRHRINEHLSFHVTGQRLKRDSTDDTLDRERNFYGFGLNYSF
jgi:putative beta-barrel porin BBP2